MAEVDLQWSEPKSSPKEALSRLLHDSHVMIDDLGHRLDRRTSTQVSFTRRRLLGRNDSFGVLVLEDPEGGSHVSVQGTVRPKLHSTLSEIAQMRKVDAELGKTPSIDEVPETAVEANGDGDGELTEMEEELQRIYVQVGKPLGFVEAKEKVKELAEQLRTEGLSP